MSREAPTTLGEALADPLGPSATSRSGTWLFTLFVLFIAFWDLGGRSLHNLDLARFGVLAREMVATGEWIVPTRYGEVYANKPPLMIWLIAAPARLVGEVTPWLVRLPCAIGLVLMVLSTALWGHVRLRSVVAGRVAALLLLGTFLLTWLGREGRPDMLAAGLAAFGTVLLDGAALGRGRRGDAWIAGVLLGLAVLAKGPPVLLLPAAVLLLPGDGENGRLGARLSRARLDRVGLALLVTVLLWLVPAWLEGGAAYVHELAFEQVASRVAGTANKLEPLPYYFVRLLDAGAPWTPLYVAGLALYLTAGGRRALGAARPLAAAAWIVLVVFTLIPTKHVRYVVGVFPLLALGVGHIATTFGGRPASPRWRALPPLGGAILALSGIALIVVSTRVPGALLPTSGPAALLVGLGALCLRTSKADDPAAARRRFAGSLLVAVALWLSGYWVLRDRYRVRDGVAFDRAVAAAVDPRVPFVTVEPARPDDVFHGVPHARFVASPAEVPGRGDVPRLYVLALAGRAEDIDRRRGQTGQVLLTMRHGLAGRAFVLITYGGE